MFSSIRNRLWLTYAALIVAALIIVTTVLALFLVRNPYIYRQTSARLEAASRLLLGEPRSAARTAVIAAAMDVRVVEYSPQGVILRDTELDAALLPAPPARGRTRGSGLIRDSAGSVWLYARAKQPDGGWLVVAAPRPRLLPSLDVLGDELWRPLIQGGLLALVLALILAFFVAAWIASPLQRLVEAAGTVGVGRPGTGDPSQRAREETQRVPESGPQEVRELIGAFNAMLDRVAASQRSQRDFVSNVSHELKTPLTSIQGFAQAIRDGTAGSPEERRQAAEIIHAEAGRMHRLAVDLLDLAALDAGTVELRNAPVDLHAVLAQLGRRFEPIAALAGVKLEIALPTDLSAVAGDADRLLQVFTNLVDNAIKFTPPGGRVLVRAEQDRDEARVVVRDTGPGMSAEELAHIFERFYQADAARGGGDKHGAGLGLPIARELTEAHGGRISVRSTLGHGAEFVVHLPPPIGSREDRGAA